MVKNVKDLSREDIEELFYGQAHFCSLGCVFDENIISFWKENVLRKEIGYYHTCPTCSKDRYGLL